MYIRKLKTPSTGASSMIRAGIIFIIACMMSGCQKNSYESCIEFQSAAARRDYAKYPNLYKSEQDAIDLYVSRYCAGVK